MHILEKSKNVVHVICYKIMKYVLTYHCKVLYNAITLRGSIINNKGHGNGGGEVDCLS